MTSIDQVIKPKTQRSRRFLEQRGPRNNENDKSAMFLRGGNVSNLVTQGLKDLYSLKKPTGVLYKRKNMTRPFEDQTSLEFFSKKSDCSLFAFGSHSKKRPNNITFGRLYDHHVLDMYEFGIERFVPLKDFKNAKFPEGTKPMLLFAGNDFDNVEDYKRFKNLMIDFFRGPKVPAVRLAGLEHLIQISAWKGRVFFRSYKVFMKKSGCRTPRVELEEIGPSFDFVLRRTLVSTDDLFKLATRRAKAAQAKKKKNISHDTFGTKYGRIHMQKQDLSKLQTRKVKALKKSPEEKVIAMDEDQTLKEEKLE